jgi:hypothetical protein
MTTVLERQHTYRVTLTPCPRCKRQPGSHGWPTPWLHELTIADGVQVVHVLLCRRPSCAFAEIINLRAEAPAIRRSWLRVAVSRYPLTFAAAAVINGIAFGLLLALT